MLLNEIFGNTTRVKILQELVANWGLFLNANEISRMSDVSRRATYINLKELDEIGLLEKKETKSLKYRLKKDDKRSLIIAILEGEKHLHKNKDLISNNFSDSFEYLNDENNNNDYKRIKLKIPVTFAKKLEKTLLNNLIDNGLLNTNENEEIRNLEINKTDKKEIRNLEINKTDSKEKELEIKNMEFEIPDYLIGNKKSYNPKKENWEKLKSMKKATNGVKPVKALLDLRAGKG